jgi:hypothetical protein
VLDQGFYAAQKEPRKERKSSPILPHPDLPDKESLYCKNDEKKGNLIRTVMKCNNPSRPRCVPHHEQCHHGKAKLMACKPTNRLIWRGGPHTGRGAKDNTKFQQPFGDKYRLDTHNGLRSLFSRVCVPTERTVLTLIVGADP